MFVGALPRLTRYAIAFAAAGLIASASTVAYADDATPAPEPAVTVTEPAPAPAPETDPAAEVSSPTPDIIDVPVVSAPNSHTGGM
ncbi:hypothetical protein ACBJ59_57245 [Nonomuraea sp. MTCD27]|uniref:hypothetical protein n=1 Tax=Nonomuraea sp. MTCD27 TaxID=1676747 RepID=UPI0035C0ECA7